MTTPDDGRRHLVVIGGGPAGTAAAIRAGTLGARVTLVEKDVVGGAAHLWDCIPSKTMVASAHRRRNMRTAPSLGVPGVEREVDLAALNERMARISADLSAGQMDVLDSQGIERIDGFGRFTGPHSAEADTADGTIGLRFDLALVSTGSAPRIPAWAEPDGERVLTTRHAYGLAELPRHVVVVGAGVTGVEFTNIWASLGSAVTLVVSRQQVLPHRDPEVAAVLEADFLERGVRLVKGARAEGIERDHDDVVVVTDDGRRIRGSHVLLAIGSVPLTDGLGLEAAGVATDGGYVQVDEFNRTSVPHIYAAGDVTGQMPLSSVATMQGRKLAHHAMGRDVRPIDYRRVAQAVFTEPEIASVGLEEADAAAEGRRIRTTKVPFATNSRSVIQDATRGFVKLISDPVTHQVLGGTIVGYRASELIGIIALAVQARVHVDDVVDTLMVHPSLSESISEAAD
ncbi:MAG: NAD(P)H-quinone dehydrogenase [Acidimicrobiia bacterium]